MKTQLALSSAGLILGLIPHFEFSASAQGTAFTYQGRFNDGNSPANGSYDFRFTTYDAVTNGNVVAGPLTNSLTAISNGLFTVMIDFGASVFSGPDRWLDIAARTNGGGAFQGLSPRQKLAPVPYAVYAAGVNGTGISGSIPGSSLAGNYGNALALTNPANVFSGNGSGLTSLNASQLTNGTLPDARLSGNVALRNATNTFTATQIINANLGIGTNAPTAQLHVNGQVRITGGSPAVGKVLTSDSSGTAVWSATRSNPQVVIVDAAGNGDFSSVSAAVAAISPSASTPFTIEVRPGLYFDRIVLKSYVHLEGAGPDSSIIMFNMAGATNDSDLAVVKLNNLTNVSISGFTLTTQGYTNASQIQAAVGVYDTGSSPEIMNDRFVLLAGAQPITLPQSVFGICSVSSAPVICHCDFENNRAVDAISLVQSSSSVLENVFTNHYHAVSLTASSAEIVNNQMNALGEAVLLDANSSATVALNDFKSSNTSRAVNNQGQARIIGNKIDTCNVGINNAGEAIISGNRIEDCASSGISDTSARSTISGNVLVNCGAGSGSFALTLLNSSATVVGNAFASNTFGDISIGGSGTPLVNANATTGVVRGAGTLAGFGTASISTTSSSNLVFNAAGGVGLGEANPAAALHLLGPNGIPPTGLASADNGLLLGSLGTSGYKWAQSYGGPLVLNPVGNNVGVATTNPTALFQVFNAQCDGNNWNKTSERNLKENFAPLDTGEILQKVLELPIQTWNYKQAQDVRHLGPTAQDFHAAFALGADDKHIGTVDEGGVALAAIQGLNRKLEAELSRRDAENTELRKELSRLQNLIPQARVTSPPNRERGRVGRLQISKAGASRARALSARE